MEADGNGNSSDNEVPCAADHAKEPPINEAMAPKIVNVMDKPRIRSRIEQGPAAISS